MTGQEKSVIDIRQIFDMLPHRYPFLLVDRVIDFEPGVSLTAIKNVSFNEPFFQGHFPGLPVFPGVLIMEALAQAGGILVVKSSTESPKGKIFMFTGMDKVRFRRPVYPGDQLVLRLKDVRQRMQLVKMTGQAEVNGELAAEGMLSAAIIDRHEI